ncbi:hypothetical protein DPMN_013326 [Dreissena polymorpha]|uniref:Uncharacterized protein n=1 Tax=Dreissena polymorpha TaxID=45954 RepID=A0A9D4S3P3_DREPO|nr:hypothetical protein DPMN_013326 [Dreissena polymorpha]
MGLVGEFDIEVSLPGVFPRSGVVRWRRLGSLSNSSSASVSNGLKVYDGQKPHLLLA